MTWTPPEGQAWTPPKTSNIAVPEPVTTEPDPAANDTRPVWKPGSPPPVEPEPRKEVRETHSPDVQGGLVKTWSATLLDTFEKCPHAVFLSRVKKAPRVENEAANRGIAIHQMAEDYITGVTTKLPAELKKFEKAFESERIAYDKGSVIVEEDWGFDKDWNTCGWMAKEVWARMKLDIFEFHDSEKHSATVTDVKTGKKFGNEIKHNRQGRIYAIGSFMRFPSLEYIRTEFRYVDHGEVLQNVYTRPNLVHLLPQLTKRAVKLTSTLDFPPRPSRSNCKFCDHAKNGACDYAEI